MNGHTQNNEYIHHNKIITVFSANNYIWAISQTKHQIEIQSTNLQISNISSNYKLIKDLIHQTLEKEIDSPFDQTNLDALNKLIFNYAILEYISKQNDS